MNNIKKLREEAGLTLRELADRLDVHFTTVAKIERSQRKLTHEWLMRFATALHVAPSQIVDDYELAGFPLVATQHPVIGMVAAGNWREAIQETQRYIAAPVKARNAFGLVVTGDSMDRIAPDGAVVMVDPDAADLHDGAYYVIMNGDGDATFKQYRANPARLEPCSTNPAHNVITLGREQFNVVGKVVGVYQSFA